MPGPYTRVASGDPGNSGATSAVTIVNAHSVGLERLEGTTRNALDYGVVRDARPIQVQATASSATVAALDVANLFVAGDVGKSLYINAAGTAGAMHSCTISSVAGGNATVTPAPVSSASTGAVVGTDNTAAINSMISASAAYDTLRFPGGSGQYLTQGGHVLSKVGQKVRGDFEWSSQIVAVGNGVVFERTVNNGGMSDLLITHAARTTLNFGYTNGSWPTAGAAVKITGTASPWDGGYTERMEVFGFYRGIWIEAGVHRVSDVRILDYGRAGIECYNPGYPDYGGYIFSRCWISSVGPGSPGGQPVGEAGVLWGGSGGFQMNQCWVDGGASHVLLRPTTVAGLTGNIGIHGCSFEDWGYGPGSTGHAIFYDYTATSSYNAYISITGNVFQAGSSNAALKFIAASNPSPDGFGNFGLRSIAITGNAGKFTGFFADLTRCRDVAVVGNTNMGVTSLLNLVTQTSCTNVTVA